jgi:hypothetical protein
MSDSIETSDSSRHRFRRQVMKLSNQNKNMEKLKCEISQNEYPARHVVAGHIFKKSFGSRKLKNILNLPDINDPGNGILMFVSIEHHFDLGNICLVKYDESDDHYHLKVLRKDLECTSIIEEGVRVGNVNMPIGSYEQPITTTFKDLETLQIKLDNRYKRLICFHMHIAMKQKNILGVDFGGVYDGHLFNIIDFWSPEQKEMNYIDKIQRWFDLNEHQSKVRHLRASTSYIDILLRLIRCF